MFTTLRESGLFRTQPTGRRSIVGSFIGNKLDMYREKLMLPHEIMASCVDMYNRNSYTQSAVNTMKEFIKGGDIKVMSHDGKSKEIAQEYFNKLRVNYWIDEVIENTIKTGNAYVEFDFADTNYTIPIKAYPLADSSRIYINCDEYGRPVPYKSSNINTKTGEYESTETPNTAEFYIQTIDEGANVKGKYFTLRYYGSGMFRQYRIYGIPIPMQKILHFKLNIGDTGIYGQPYIGATLDDYEVLRQIERSIAIIAKHKAVPRDIISYGDKDNPATDDETGEFIMYLESLQKDESAIINKSIKRETLSYAGEDINLDYMIQHIKKKMIAGIAPDFMMGLSSDMSGGQQAQISLLSYILAVYSKRRLFLQPLEDFLLKPFIERHGLKDCWLEFGELDFETKSEKVNRVGAMWTQNMVTFNEMRALLGMTKLPDMDIFYMQHQANLQYHNTDINGDNSIDLDEEQRLPNGETIDKMFSHNEAPNKKAPLKDGKLSFDPYQKRVNTPKLVPRKQLDKSRQQ